MKVVFISNYMNHHQLPISNAFLKIVGENNYKFIATSPITEERKNLGYYDYDHILPYIITTYDKDVFDKEIELVGNADLVICGGAPRRIAQILLRGRIRDGKIIFRYSERIFKKSMWQAISPARIVYMIVLHTFYRNRPIYMLSAGAYLPVELTLFRAYPNKMFMWGYFPSHIPYDIDKVIADKPDKKIRILWVGRLIDWKHPEILIDVAKILRDKTFEFQIDIVGKGLLEESLKNRIIENSLDDKIALCGSMSPENVRLEMKSANIVIVSSDFHEGWGAVINEAMNSGCVVIASHAIGSVPYLIKHRENGIIYESGNTQDLCNKVLDIIDNRQRQKKLGRNAYNTIANVWNAENAVISLIKLSDSILRGNNVFYHGESPCCKAHIVTSKQFLGKVKEIDNGVEI